MAILNTHELTFVRLVRLGHLGTAARDGEPHVVPVCYAIVADSAYVLIDRKPKRVDDPRALKRVANILDNPRACLTVDHYDEDWTRLAFVMMRGPATLISSGAAYDTALAALMHRYPQYRHQQLDGRPMIELEIQRVSSWGRLTS